MSDPTQLEFTANPITSGNLEIRVKNSGVSLDKRLLIEINIPVDLVNKRISDAAGQARENEESNLVSLAGVVTVAPGWSVWAFNEQTASIATLRLFNLNIDLVTGELGTPVKFEAANSFTIRIPVTEQAGGVLLDIPYGYQYGEEGARVDGKLKVEPHDPITWNPNVNLITNQQSPTMIPAGEDVEIRWEIENGVSATLRGPLPGGNSELTLTTDRKSPYWIEKGNLKFIAVGPAIYTLDAEVRGPENKPNVRVIKTLAFDIYSSDKYSHLSVYPTTVLPNGLFDISWAVWGVEKATLKVGKDYHDDLDLTEQNLSRHYQGTGIQQFGAPNEPGTEISIRLIIMNDPKHKTSKHDSISVAEWVDPKPKFTGQPLTGRPLGLAVATPKMALLTSEGLWTATVGERDSTKPTDLNFSKVNTDAPKAWLALAAFDKNFVVLRRTAADGLQVANYLSDGKPDGAAVDLPEEVQEMVRHAGTVYDLVAFGQRVYVVVETPAPGGFLRRAFSVTFKPLNLRSEAMLATLANYRLVIFDGALYALNRASGEMFRFGLARDGGLEPPRKAASAVKGKQSIIWQGLIVPVGSVLAVLSPTSFFDELEMFAVGSVMFLQNPYQGKNPKKITQDLIYNPQRDEWAPCGNGLRVQNGAVAAFRAGSSKRLWLMQPDGKMHTLAGANEDLFASDYVEESPSIKKFPSKPLPLYLDAKKKFSILNDTNKIYVPMSDVYRNAGLDGFSSTGPASVSPMPGEFWAGEHKKFEFTCNEAAPAPINLRFLAKRSRRPADDYDDMLELTFSGAGLSSVTSVLKRLAVDGQGKVSITELPDTSVQYPAGSMIVVKAPKGLT
jgi:hypothetical protein